MVSLTRRPEFSRRFQLITFDFVTIIVLRRSGLASMEPMPPSASPPRQRLLIPIDSREESLGCLRYALNRAAARGAIEVCLVYFLPPVGQGELLRFRAEQQDAEQRQQRADTFLEEAAAHLRVAGVPCQTFVREADLVQGIRDFAEEWVCSEVVLPNAHRLDLFSGGQRRQLNQLAQALRVVWVDGDGSPELQLDDGRI